MTATSLTVHAETGVEDVYSVGIYGRDMLYSNVPINFNNAILTTVTKYPHVVTEWIEGVREDGNTGRRHVGFEVELDYSRDVHIGTAQFCVGNQCLVFQLGDNEPPCPPSLEEFLCDHNNFSFVGTLVEWKMQKLIMQLLGRQRLSSPIAIRDLGFYDIQLYARKGILLSSVALPGVLRNRDWARNSNLSRRQVHYACLDAFLNLHIAKCLDNFLS